MSDYLIREKLQTLTGLTKYSQEKVLVPVALADDTWVDVMTLTNTEVHRIFCAYQLTLTGDPVTLPVLRFLAAPTGTTLDDSTKVFPFGDEIEFISGISSSAINIPVQLPVSHDFKLQVKVQGTGALVSLDSLSVIQVPTLNHV